MRVSELIKILQTYDPDKPVVFDDEHLCNTVDAVIASVEDGIPVVQLWGSEFKATDFTEKQPGTTPPTP